MIETYLKFASCVLCVSGEFEGITLCIFCLLFFSFADLQKPQTELDGKACAGVGQSSLMAYYETMFDQVGDPTFLFFFLLLLLVSFQVLMCPF